eukprot:Sspe_Gene.23997::Locus_9416_Transcript_1_1_Confidence_1.000_Length_947::g.23997::m.23997
MAEGPSFSTPADIGRWAERLACRGSARARVDLLATKGVSAESSRDDVPTNIVVYLHGFGDSPRPFREMAARINLPQTSSAFPTGQYTLPLELEGTGWYPFAALLADLYPSTEAARKAEREGRERAVGEVLEVLKAIGEVGWGSATTFLVGHGQGAELATWVAAGSPKGMGGVLLIDLPPDASLPDSAPPVSCLSVGTPQSMRKRLLSLYGKAAALASSGSAPPKPGVEFAAKEELTMVKWFSKVLPLQALGLANDPSIVQVSQGVVG